MGYNSYYRAIDASINRLSEGVRVIEDLCRFSLSLQVQATKLKGLRHDVKAVWGSLDSQLLESRDVMGDEGRVVQANGEYRRESIRDILRANFCRAQESMRSLEEISKLILPSQAEVLEKMRYELYDLEQDIRKNMESQYSYPKQHLYVLVTKKLCKLDPVEVLEAACRGGADVIQLREKQMEDGEFLDWIRQAKAICDRYKVPLIVNDRIHLAVLSDAAGVHMGQGDLKTSDARALLKEGQWLGRSTHGMDQASTAASEGVDYIGVGPLYLTQTKEHRHAVGLQYLKDVDEKLDIPYVGIGAVNREHWDEILTCKPSGLAICTAIIGHEDPEEETRFYKKGLESIWSC
jgi:thiamine-phosphate pyrophosphorylase